MNKLTKIVTARSTVRSVSKVQAPCSIDVRAVCRRELVQSWTNDPDSGRLICAWSTQFRRDKGPRAFDALERAASDVHIAA
jgi:hypothetical protein